MSISSIKKFWHRTLLELSSNQESYPVQVKSRYELEQEIARLKLVESELQQRYQILTENLAASVIIRDCSGRLAYVSPYTIVLTGYSAKALYTADGDFFGQIVHPDERTNYLNAIKVSEQGEPYQSRFRIIHQTGIEIWVEMRCAPIFNDQAEIDGILAIILDVTSQVRYQKQIEERTRDLHDISYMISHDLRSPILTIKGMVEVLKQDLSSANQINSSVDQTINFISSAIGRLEDLIGSVLNYFKLSSVEVENSSFALRELTDNVIADLRALTESSQAKIEIIGPIVQIESDKQKFYRVLSNLISNALKYRDPQRQLEVKIYWEISSSGRDLELSVEDNGIGIAQEKLQAIFRPFQRVNGSSDVAGFGVGLASVKKLLHAIGGNIEVESQLNQSTKFKVTVRNCNPVLNSNPL